MDFFFPLKSIVRTGEETVRTSEKEQAGENTEQQETEQVIKKEKL